MLKNAKAGLAGRQTGEAKDISQAVLDSSRHIWLAGLGAFARAQAEGTKVFETLVKQGESLESKTRKAAADTAALARGAATAKVKEVQKGVGGTWDKLEQVFEHRVERALSKLGVYTQNDVERLAKRVDVLSEAVNELIKATGVRPGRRPAASTASSATGAMSSASGTAKKTVRTAKKTVRGGATKKGRRASLK